jgi:tail tube protein
MQAIVGSNVKVEIHSTLIGASPPLTPTVLTKANPGVATATAHGLVTGDVVRFVVPEGMVELDGQAVRVIRLTADTFSLEGLDTTDYDAWTTGTVDVVDEFVTYAASTAISMPNPTPAKLDKTVLLDKSKHYVYGMPDAPDGSATALFNPGGTAEGIIKVATRTNSPLIFRITFATGQKRIFNANVSGGDGFTMGSNAVATAQMAFTPVAEVVDYTI